MKQLHKIKSWWHFEGRYYHKDFMQGIRNLRRWFAVIWKDRDHDHTYIYKILQHKLEQQAYGIGSRSRHTMSQRDAELMLLCARLCHIQQEELYENEYMDYVKKKYELVPVGENDEWYTMEYETIEDNLDDYFALYPRQYKLATAGEFGSHKQKYREELAMEIAHNNQKRSKRLLFKILQERIGTWWD